jgi:hypothetical protein
MVKPMNASELVTLRSGISVPLVALQLLWHLEDRGLNVRVDADGSVLVGPHRRLTDHDRGLIREYRDDLRRIVAGVEAEAVQ